MEIQIARTPAAQVQTTNGVGCLTTGCGPGQRHSITGELENKRLSAGAICSTVIIIEGWLCEVQTQMTVAQVARFRGMVASSYSNIRRDGLL